MNFKELLTNINSYKNISGTNQKWLKDSPLSYENEYMKLRRIDTSNKHGGKSVINGKQWSIIFERKKDFECLPGWIKLKSEFKKDLKITKVKNLSEDLSGIRLYNMGENPNNTIIIELLNFIFENKN